MRRQTDFLVIGSGIAGLHSAITLYPYGSVLLITKQKLSDAATAYAQGGIAVASQPGDSIKSHINDTMIAGRFHNKKSRVALLTGQGKRAISQLEELGVHFDKTKAGTFITSYEAAHSYPRIFHASDFTGREIEYKLIEHLIKIKQIEIWEYTQAIDLYVHENRCYGAYVIKDGNIIAISSGATIIATGGIGQLYQWTTNPFVSTGDGIAMASKNGAKLRDLEFIQFHPTALKEQASPLFLLSEALRGEGAVLRDKDGNRFMHHFHSQEELAPRDVVSHAVFLTQQKGSVYLDMTTRSKEYIIKRFPNIYHALLERGYDLTNELIPITPAQHFVCGGIETDEFGRTSILNLFACGEVAYTGVHGANRLASNSLLEAFVFSGQLIHNIHELPAIIKKIPLRSRFDTFAVEDNEIRNKIKITMWNNVGVERNRDNLQKAVTFFQQLQLRKVKKEIRINNEIELSNMIEVGALISQAASKRTKTLGAHIYKNEE